MAPTAASLLPASLPLPAAAESSRYLVGPDTAGGWSFVSVLSIKHKESSVACAEAGQSATFCLQVLDATTKLRRGMVLLERPLGARDVVWELDAAVRALRLPNPVPVGTEIVLHCVAVKQAARVLAILDSRDGAPLDKLRDGAEARLRLRLVHAAEFVQLGSPCILRDASSGADHLGVAVGTVVSTAAVAPSVVRGRGAAAVASGA